MPVCPKCQNSLKSDFGLETCSKCGTVMFVDMDGNVSLQEDVDHLADLETETSGEIVTGDPLSADSASDVETTEDMTNNVFDFSSGEMTSLTNGSVESSEDSEDLFEAFESADVIGGSYDQSFKNESLEDGEDDETESDDANDDDVEEYEASEYLSEDEDVAEDDEDDDSSEYEDALSAEDDSGDEYVVTTADDFLEEMQMFGEIDSDKFKESIYFFDIEIAGIDSKDIRDSIMDSLDDDRLNLAHDDLHRKIINGVLVLKSISAVKAYVVIQRISHLPCEVSWTLVEVQDLVSNNSFNESNADLTADDYDSEIGST